MAQRALRRSYGIPDLVGDELAMDALTQNLVSDYHMPPHGVDVIEMARVVVDEVLNRAAAAELDQEFLPEDLRTTWSQPEWRSSPSQIVAGALRGRRSEWLTPPNVSPDIDYYPVITAVLEKLRSYLLANPLEPGTVVTLGSG